MSAQTNTAPAAPNWQAELEATNRQVEILSDALAESRREVEALTNVQEPVAYRSRMRNRDGQVITGWVVHTDTSDNPDPRIEIEPLYTTPPAAQPAPVQEPVAWCDLLKQAEEVVRSKPLWKKFIDGTPLANDIPVWMADFAQQYAQPTATVQEPKKDLMFSTVAMQEREDQRIERIVGTLEKVKHERLAALATPPAAQRQWVSLTDEELELLNDCGDTDSYKFARAIEAKLREKNGGQA